MNDWKEQLMKIDEQLRTQENYNRKSGLNENKKEKEQTKLANKNRYNITNKIIERSKSKISNLGYAFQSQEYYLEQLHKTAIRDDVQRIIDFKLDDKIKFICKHKIELESLVKRKNYESDIGIFQAKVKYPGLVIGMSNPLMCSLKQNTNDDNQNDAFKTGFNFDYVTGLPYIPGSSIKGMLRASINKYKEDVRNWLNEGRYSYDQQVKFPDDVINQLFGAGNDDQEKTIGKDKKNTDVSKRDIFLDALIVAGDEDGTILKSDYITPHPSMFKNPIPIRILALKPNVKLQFHFLLFNDEIAGISKENRFELYKGLILELGIGAKTNTGYGCLTETRNENGKE